MSSKQPHSNSVHACMFNHELLVAYASGNVDPHERGTVERHLAQCAKCRREITELERVWWSLDTWMSVDSEGEETEPIQPRLNDLRARIAASQKQTPVWQQWVTTLRQNAASLWDSFQPKPAMAFGIFLILALFVVPIMKQKWDQSPLQPTGTPNMANVPKEATREQNVQLASNRIEVAKATPEHSVNTFDEALAQSIRDENQAKQERKMYSGSVKSPAVNVGYSPNANIVPAHNISSEHRPMTYNPAMYYNYPRVE